EAPLPVLGSAYGSLGAGFTLTFGLGTLGALQHEVAAFRPHQGEQAGQFPAFLAKLVEVAADEPGAVFTALSDVLRPFRRDPASKINVHDLIFPTVHRCSSPAALNENRSRAVPGRG